MKHWALSLRRAWRILLRNRAFAIAFILTLALASGALTAFFSVVYGSLLRPLPYDQPKDLVYFQWTTEEGTVRASSGAKVDFWRRHSEAFESIAAFELQAAGATLVTDKGFPEYVPTVGVTPELFSVLGTPPLHGPGFGPLAGEGGEPCSFVASAHLWESTWKGDPEPVGKSVELDGELCTLVGVLPSDFRFQPPADIFVPIQATEGAANLYGMLGRLAQDTTFEQAQSEAATLFANFHRTSSDVAEEEKNAALVPYREYLTGGLENELWLLFAAGALVFLIGVVNLSNLLVTRSQRRNRSTAMHLALGARRRDLVLQTVLEVSVAALLATLLGWGLARLLVPAVLAMEATALPNVAAVQVSWAEALFAGIMSSLAILAIALVPTLRMTRGDLSQWLRPSSGSGTQGTADKMGQRLGRGMVVVQVALSLAVLLAAFAVVHGLLRVSSVDSGFESEGVWTLQVPLQGERYTEASAASAFARNLQRRLAEDPGVRWAAVATSLPLETGLNVPVESEGEELGSAVEYRAVSSDYFKLLDIDTIQGRSFQDTDRADSAPVALINESLAAKLPDEALTLDRSLRIARGMGPLADRPRRIVGVVEDVRDVALGAEPAPVVYVPHDQMPEGLAKVVRDSFPLAILIRLDSAESPTQKVREALAEVDSSLAAAHVRPLETVVTTSLARERFYALLLSLFGMVALVLTALGIYGLVSSQMERRIKEIAIRMAVGARASEVLRLVMGESLRLSALGIGLGIPLAFGMARFLRSVVYGTQGIEGLGILVVSALLVLLTLAATYVPAQRAVRLDPARVLR